jgi:hypothetical protein
MIETKGDLWVVRGDAKVITTNGSVRKDGCAVMGRGVARQAALRWPELPRTLGNSLGVAGNYLCTLGHFSYDPERESHINPAMPLPTEGFELVAFPVKERWMEAACPRLIYRSAVQLVAMTEYKGWEKVILPRPGCGNGGLEWDDVRSILTPLLDDRFVIVQI